jgi:hypothetical protein
LRTHGSATSSFSRFTRRLFFHYSAQKSMISYDSHTNQTPRLVATVRRALQSKRHSVAVDRLGEINAERGSRDPQPGVKSTICARTQCKEESLPHGRSAVVVRADVPGEGLVLRAESGAPIRAASHTEKYSIARLERPACVALTKAPLHIRSMRGETRCERRVHHHGMVGGTGGCANDNTIVWSGKVDGGICLNAHEPV